MSRLFSPPKKKVKTLTTTVYSLAAVDKETYLLLQCTVNVTRKRSTSFSERNVPTNASTSGLSKTPRSTLPALLMAAASSGRSHPILDKISRVKKTQNQKLHSEEDLSKHRSSANVSPASPKKVPRISVSSSSLVSTSSACSQPNTQTVAGGSEAAESDESSSEEHLWKPIASIKFPRQFNTLEKILYTGHTDSELMKKLSKKHFQNQAMIRQSAKSSSDSTTDDEGASASQVKGASASQAQGASTSQAQDSPGQVLSNGSMSLVYFHRYLYAIGFVVCGKATECVLRIEIFPKDATKLTYTWKRVPYLPRPSPYHASNTLIDSTGFDNFDSILVIGGKSSSSARLQRLCFTDNRYEKMIDWKKDDTRSDLQIHRMKHCLIAVAGGIYVMGGMGKDDLPVLYSEKSINNRELDEDISWKLISPLSQAKVSFVVLSHENYIYAIGGCHTTEKGVVTMERCKTGSTKPENWTSLNGFQTDTHCLIGCVIEDTICILGGKPKTFDLKSSDDVYSITWNLSPTIDLPTIYFENTVSTVVQVKEYVRESR